MRLPWKRREQWQERLGRNKTILWEKLREALASVVPITVIVLILSFTVAPIPTETLLAFLIGAVMVILGIGLFSLGADTAMTPIGERVGAAMTRSRKLWVVAAVGFLIGVIVTVSEPDLQVLAQQVPGVPNATLVGAVAVGVGVFLVIAMLRILFRIPLNRMLIVFYILVFALALFVPEDFLAIAFDSGGVTTGPMTVPFIMALGVGVATVRGYRGATPGDVVNRVVMTDYNTGEESVPLDVAAQMNPKSIYLMFGANALAARDDEAVEDSFIAYYGQMIDLLREAAPEADIYVQTMTPVAADYSSTGIYKERIQRVNQKLANMALEKGVYFVDVYSALADENGDLVAEYSSDGLHMVAAGYKAWADCLAGHVAYSADNPYVMGSEYYIAK